MGVRLAHSPDRPLDATVEALVTSVDGLLFPLDEKLEHHEIEGSWVWLAAEAGITFAYALMEVKDDAAYLSRAGVLPNFRGQGTQAKLIQARLRAARRLGLRRAWTYTEVSNPASANSLIRAGFRTYWPHKVWTGRQKFVYWQKELA